MGRGGRKMVFTQTHHLALTPSGPPLKALRKSRGISLYTNGEVLFVLPILPLDDNNSKLPCRPFEALMGFSYVSWLQWDGLFLSFYGNLKWKAQDSHFLFVFEVFM